MITVHRRNDILFTLGAIASSALVYWTSHFYYQFSTRFSTYLAAASGLVIAAEQIGSIVYPIFELPFVHKHSRIDDRVLLYHSKWAVTLICYKGCCGNHAQIIIEGVRLNRYFMKMADFNGESG
ncbi:MAG: hypothetical protein WCP39_08350, partial [Chlamydiota bacterium]